MIAGGNLTEISVGHNYCVVISHSLRSYTTIKVLVRSVRLLHSRGPTIEKLSSLTRRLMTAIGELAGVHFIALADRVFPWR